MAVITKIDYFMQVSGIAEDTKRIVEETLKPLHEIEKNKERQVIKKKYPHLYDKMVALEQESFERIKKRILQIILESAREILSQHFTDQEIDQLIDLYSLPIYQKMRNLSSILFVDVTPIAIKITDEESEIMKRKINKMLGL